jgi:hypothetical protein
VATKAHSGDVVYLAALRPFCAGLRWQHRLARGCAGKAELMAIGGVYAELYEIQFEKQPQKSATGAVS